VREAPTSSSDDSKLGGSGVGRQSDFDRGPWWPVLVKRKMRVGGRLELMPDSESTTTWRRRPVADRDPVTAARQGDAEPGRSTTTRNPKLVRPKSVQLVLITGPLAWIEVGGL